MKAVDPPPGEVLIMGAGAVGCFIGGCLAAAGARVCFVGRAHVLQGLSAHGLKLTDLDGGSRQLRPAELRLAEQVPAGIAPSLVLLTVKSGATAEAAAELNAKLPAGTPVLSLQNGVSNARVAQRAAPKLRVLPGMVPYNIAQLAPGVFHRGTQGRLVAQGDSVLTQWVEFFAHAGVPLELRGNIGEVQWGKLLVNLNNPVNAISGLPLRAQLMDRGYRRCFAGLIEEALHVLDAAGIEPAQVLPLSPRRLITVLRLPNLLFRIVAARMLRIDPDARSSMADDVALGRRTEVDVLCGEIVRLARANRIEAPRAQKMVELLDGAWPRPVRSMSSRRLCHALGMDPH